MAEKLFTGIFSLKFIQNLENVNLSQNVLSTTLDDGVKSACAIFSLSYSRILCYALSLASSLSLSLLALTSILWGKMALLPLAFEHKIFVFMPLFVECAYVVSIIVHTRMSFRALSNRSQLSKAPAYHRFTVHWMNAINYDYED